MRLKHTTAEIAPTLRPAQTPLTHAARQSGEQVAASQTPGELDAAASLARKWAAPVNTTRQGAKCSWRTLAHAIGMAAVSGVLYSFFARVLSLSVVGWRVPGTNPLMVCADVAVSFLPLLLPVLLAFYLGWRRRDGVQGALLGFTLGVSLLLGSIAYFVSPMSPGPIPFSINEPTTRVIVAAFLLLGMVGGVSGQALQTRRAQRGKANR